MNGLLQSLDRLVFSSPIFPEEPNGLYEAFWLRRKGHTRGREPLGRRLRRFIGSWRQVRGSLLPAAIWVMVMVAVNHANVWSIGGLLFLIVLFYLLRSQSGQIVGVMPSTLASLLTNAPQLRSAMTDIWMTGAGGRALVHALYREARESDRIASLWTLAVLYLVGLAAYFYFRSFSFFRASGFFLSILLLFLAVAYAGGNALGYRGLKEIEHKWKRDMETAKSYAEALFRALFIGILTVIGILLVGIFLAFVIPFWELLPSAAHEIAWEYYASFAILAFAAFLLAISPGIRRRNEKRICESAFAIEDMYNFYVRMMVVGDPEYR